MSVQPGHLSLVAAAPVAPREPATPATAARSAPAPEAAVRTDVVPAAPPPEVTEAVDRAFDRAAELHAANRELHFSKDPSSGRIVVEVRDLEGHVIRTIPPSQALGIMAGEALP